MYQNISLLEILKNDYNTNEHKTLFLTWLNKYLSAYQMIVIQNKTYTIEHKKLCDVGIFNFELYVYITQKI